MMTYQEITNINFGEEVFEHIPSHIRPGWAGLILSRFDIHIKNIPAAIQELYSIIDNEERWNEAHKQFSKIRQFLLADKSFEPQSYLLLAENCAKVAYNASGQPAPFDHDSGWWIPKCAIDAANYFSETQLRDEIESAILIFERNKKFKENLKAAKDFLLYKRLDNILWFDWDPIGVNDQAPRDEYQGYVPLVFNLKQQRANKEQIAQELLKLEQKTIGVGKGIEHCRIVADKILNA